MKLNLNFDLYKGTTRLKQWYKEVKAHFTEVQEAHNALEDTVAAESGKLSTEITQRTNADIALSDRINAEENTRSSADASLGQRITTEENARKESDNEIKASIAQMRADYFGDGSMLTFEWTGEVPDARFVSEGGSEPCVDVDLSGMFELDGVPCGIMTATEILLNYVEDNNGEVTSFNNGVTYIIASFNTKTQEIEVTWSDEYEETSVTDNICRFTAARYYIETQANSSGGYSFISNSGTSYKVSATVSKAALMDKVEQNSQAISVLRDNINSEATTRETADAALEDKINYIISLRPSDREIFVMCDGDHDELKIQEALDTVGVGGTVYPIGYTIALSNSNVVTSYVSGFKSILKIPAYVTLDFRYCSNAVVFYNDAPATMQILFDLGQNSTLSNVKIDIDEDTVLSTSITPTLINTRTYCVIDNLTLYNWFGLSSALGNVYGIYVGQYGLFRNNNITNWNCGKLGSGQSLIRFEENTKLYDNTFDAITAEAGSGGNLFYFGLCTGSNNKFYNLSFGGSKLNVGSAYSFFSQNDFYKLTDARFSINGLWSCNMFRTLTGVNDDYMFTLASNAKMDNNKFIALTQSSEEYVNCFSMSNAHFTNNQFISISISANTAFIAASSGIIANNLFNARNVSDTINIVECVNGAVVKDNCTNASSIGTYDSTCVVEGNVTGFGV